MYQTTREWITKRAEQSGLSVNQLMLDPIQPYWDIFMTFDGSADETLHLGDTIYVVNICDWLAEQCQLEGTINRAVANDPEPLYWSIEAYPAARFEGDSPIYRVDSDHPEYGCPVVCSWNAGGDPVSGCDELITGLDNLCNKHRKSNKVLSDQSEG